MTTVCRTWRTRNRSCEVPGRRTELSHGKLVPQDPCDEPASELLARIRTTREAEGTRHKSGISDGRRKRTEETVPNTNQYIRQQVEDNKLQIYVVRISWPHPHTPEVSWKRVRSLPQNASSDAINDAIANVLSNKRYFGTCEVCSATLPVGHMHSDALCHGCAERTLGVIH